MQEISVEQDVKTVLLVHIHDSILLMVMHLVLLYVNHLHLDSIKAIICKITVFLVLRDGSLVLKALLHVQAVPLVDIMVIWVKVHVLIVYLASFLEVLNHLYALSVLLVFLHLEGEIYNHSHVLLVHLVKRVVQQFVSNVLQVIIRLLLLLAVPHVRREIMLVFLEVLFVLNVHKVVMRRWGLPLVFSHQLVGTLPLMVWHKRYHVLLDKYLVHREQLHVQHVMSVHLQIVHVRHAECVLPAIIFPSHDQMVH